MFKNKQTKTELSETDQVIIKKIQILTEAVEKVYPSTKGLILRSFIQGVFVGLGTTVGLALVLGLLSFVLGGLENVPVLKDIIDKSKIREVVVVEKK